MYALVTPSSFWPQASFPHNQQIIYGQFPAYVVTPVTTQAMLGPSVQPMVGSTQLSAWSNTPAAAALTGYRDNNDTRISSSDDDVFWPANATTATSRIWHNGYTAPYLNRLPVLSTTSSSGPETPQFNFTTTMNAYSFNAQAIRLPDKYKKNSQGKGRLTPRRPKRRSAKGSLNSTGGTSNSSHNTSRGHTQDSSAPDLHLENLSDVIGSNNTSASDLFPTKTSRGRLDRNTSGEMSSVSSCVLPLSLRAALNEDPPEPPQACAPLKTSSPIRESEEFLSLPSVIPPSMQKAVRATFSTLPPLSVNAKVFQPRRKTQYEDKQKEKDTSTEENSTQRKRRDGRYIKGMLTSTTPNDSGQESGGKFARVSTDQENDADVDQCMRILKQREQTGAADEQARRREEFLLILEAERERQRRLVLPKKAPKMNCKFCRNNGESEEVYTKHRLHDKERTVCPILRHYMCRLCNSTGDFAHTIRHCPFNNRKDGIAWKATFMA